MKKESHNTRAKKDQPSRFSTTSIIGIFVIGWLLGCVCVFFAIDTFPSLNNFHPLELAKLQNKVREEYKIIKENVHFMGVSSSKDGTEQEIKLAALTSAPSLDPSPEPTSNPTSSPTEEPPMLYESNVLPKFPQYNSTGIATEEKWIMMDWPVDDRLFTVENYKALESVMSAYPTGIFRVMLMAPNDAYVHKTGNQLSVMHFIKYKRKGYDIEAFPVGSMAGGQLRYGEEYRQRWMLQCCHRCNAKCRISDHVQPYHLLTFVRLLKLWRRGGIFTDFTFLFLGPLEPPEITQGYYMNSFCSRSEHMESWQVIEEKNVSFLLSSCTPVPLSFFR